MKRITNPIIQQEIMLVSESNLSNRQYTEKDENNKKGNQSENFKNACWNGMLKEILPELFIKYHPDTKLFIWQMRECKNTFTLELAEEPVEIDFSASIDPYCFMELQKYN